MELLQREVGCGRTGNMLWIFVEVYLSFGKKNRISKRKKTNFYE